MPGLASRTALRLVEPVLAVVFPSRCPACSSLLSHPVRGPLCEACWNSLPRLVGAACACGEPLAADAAGVCGRCRRGLSPFVGGACLGPFDGTLRTLIHELKYHGRRRAAGRLAEAMLVEPRVAALLARGRVLVPVPLHPTRQRQRGFNQAELLAAEIVRRRGELVLGSGALVRRVATASQAGLGAAHRRQNVAGAFAVRRRGAVAGRHVVLVDDVQTTGATARECARALLDAGALDVRLLTAARVLTGATGGRG